MPGETATTIPRILTVETATTPLATIRPYNYIGYFPGVQNPTGVSFKDARYKRRVSLNTGVEFPYANVPITFRV
jgi:hypothetical protein